MPVVARTKSIPEKTVPLLLLEKDKCHCACPDTTRRFHLTLKMMMALGCLGFLLLLFVCLFVCVCVCVCVCAHAFVHVWAYMCEPLPVCLYVYATDTMPVVNVCMCARVGLCTCVPGVHLYVPYRHYGRCNIQQTRP